MFLRAQNSWLMNCTCAREPEQTPGTLHMMLWGSGASGASGVIGSDYPDRIKYSRTEWKSSLPFARTRVGKTNQNNATNMIQQILKQTKVHVVHKKPKQLHKYRCESSGVVGVGQRMLSVLWGTRSEQMHISGCCVNPVGLLHP